MSPAIVLDPAPRDALPAAKSIHQNANGTTPRLLSTPLPNPSLMVTADHQLKQENAPVHAPASGEVLLHIKATGVCG
jgi:L-iditol 2-dehydrogenase